MLQDSPSRYLYDVIDEILILNIKSDALSFITIFFHVYRLALFIVLNIPILVTETSYNIFLPFLLKKSKPHNQLFVRLVAYLAAFSVPRC